MEKRHRKAKCETSDVRKRKNDRGRQSYMEIGPNVRNSVLERQRFDGGNEFHGCQIEWLVNAVTSELYFEISEY